MTERRFLLAIATSGTRALVALGELDGNPIDERRWQAGYRHGEDLLARVDETLVGAGVRLSNLAGIVVGTGPGAFTGLRVGLATAKALSRGLGIPIAGVASSEALIHAARTAGELGEDTALALIVPAGPSDRVLVLDGVAQLLRGQEEPELPTGVVLAAVDLPGRAPAPAIELGARAELGLAASMLQLGAVRIAAGGDDVALLVPEYVTLPRGIPSLRGEVRWSLDHR